MMPLHAGIMFNASIHLAIIYVKNYAGVIDAGRLANAGMCMIISILFPLFYCSDRSLLPFSCTVYTYICLPFMVYILLIHNFV